MIVASAGLAAEVTELRCLLKRLEEKLQAKPQQADQLEADLQAARQHGQDLRPHQPLLPPPSPASEATRGSHSPPTSPQHATADSPGSVLNSCLSLTLPSSSDSKAHVEEVDELEGCPPAPWGHELAWLEHLPSKSGVSAELTLNNPKVFLFCARTLSYLALFLPMNIAHILLAVTVYALAYQSWSCQGSHHS